MRPIHCEVYKNFCNAVYDSNDAELPPPGTVWVPIDRIHQFFYALSQSDVPADSYVVVSSRSDYGLAYQSEQPVWKDQAKWLNFTDLGKGYQPTILHPRCQTEHCRITDEFSAKCYAFTLCTFPAVPAQVKTWFCTNANVDEPKIRKLPFGTQLPMNEMVHHRQTNTKVYLNFSINTVERMNIPRQLARLPFVTIVPKAKPYTEYINDLSSHHFVVCPEGNGNDSYRIWETLYCGATPIIRRDRWNQGWDIPAVFVDDFSDVTEELINRTAYNRDAYNPECLDADYWEAEIHNARTR